MQLVLSLLLLSLLLRLTRMMPLLDRTQGARACVAEGQQQLLTARCMRACVGKELPHTYQGTAYPHGETLYLDSPWFAPGQAILAACLEESLLRTSSSSGGAAVSAALLRSF